MRDMDIEPVRNCVGLTDQPKKIPEAFDAETLWEKTLSDSLKDAHNADEEDLVDLQLWCDMHTEDLELKQLWEEHYVEMLRGKR